MREFVPSSSWLKLTSLLFVAPTSRTGTCTSPKLIAPVQMALGIGSSLRMAGRGQGGRVHVDIDGKTLVLSNLDKVLFPDIGLTKGDVLDYYRQIAPAILPHLAGRPPTLVRAPDGPHGPRFFEKNCPRHHPEWVRTSPGYEATGGTKGCMVDDLPTLVWLANLAALELHTHQWTADDPNHPTALVLDLDPGEPATIIDCCRVALELREILDHFELGCVVKTSGGKGL